MAIDFKAHENPAEFLEILRAALGDDIDLELKHSLMLGLAARCGEQYGRYVLTTFHSQGWTSLLFGIRVLREPFELLCSLAPERLADCCELFLDYCRDRSIDLSGANGPDNSSQVFVAAWARCYPHLTSKVGMDERLYKLTRVRPPARPPPGRLRPARREEEGLIVAWLQAFHDEATPELPAPPPQQLQQLVETRTNAGAFYVWDVAGTAQSLVARNRETPRTASIGPVYTPPAARGHGYASAAVADLSTLILESGKVPNLFTDLANATSNKIYQAVGFEPVCDYTYFLFNTPEKKQITT